MHLPMYELSFSNLLVEQLVNISQHVPTSRYLLQDFHYAVIEIHFNKIVTNHVSGYGAVGG